MSYREERCCGLASAADRVRFSVASIGISSTRLGQYHVEIATGILSREAREAILLADNDAE